MTRAHERGRVLLPTDLVEVHSKKEARLVQEQRVHSGNEWLALNVLGGQMPANDLIGDRKKPPVGTIGALSRPGAS